ncbi:MAG: hypothetical protein ACYDCO_16025 [Armatimonadota bacterium]
MLAAGRDLLPYRLDPARFIREVLLWEPWDGTPWGCTGQLQLIEAYQHVLRQQDERSRYDAGLIQNLQYYDPDQPIRNWLHIATGHGIGKTCLAGALVLHHLCTLRSIVYSFAPTFPQIHDLLWKEIALQHAHGRLPGRVGENCQLKLGEGCFAVGRATSDAGGLGTERLQGQHAPWMLFIFDEAEGIQPYVYEAVEAMASGGNVIVLLLGNPRTQASPFYLAGERRDAIRLHVSSFDHPNVREGRDVIPGAVRREWIEGMAEEYCERVPEHDPEAGTLELPWMPGVVWKPTPPFLWRVLGIAPAGQGEDTLIAPGRYRAACERAVPTNFDPRAVRIGVDAARWGTDQGTVYGVFSQGTTHIVRRLLRFAQQNNLQYAGRIADLLLELKARYTQMISCHVRVDGTGGFGSGVVDVLRANLRLAQAFPDFQVVEVNFAAKPYDETAYADIACEMYGLTNERLRALYLENPPDELRADLTDRRYEWKLREGQFVKRLEDKDKFRERHRRSPDDGDGFVLAVAPDHLFPGMQFTGRMAVGGQRPAVAAYRPR